MGTLTNQPVAAFDLTEAAEKRFEDMAPKKGGKDKKECVHRTSLSSARVCISYRHAAPLTVPPSRVATRAADATVQSLLGHL